jgi:hypothetical protein
MPILAAHCRKSSDKKLYILWHLENKVWQQEILNITKKKHGRHTDVNLPIRAQAYFKGRGKICGIFFS